MYYEWINDISINYLCVYDDLTENIKNSRRIQPKKCPNPSYNFPITLRCHTVAVSRVGFSIYIYLSLCETADAVWEPSTRVERGRCAALRAETTSEFIMSVTTRAICTFAPNWIFDAPSLRCQIFPFVSLISSSDYLYSYITYTSKNTRLRRV